MELTEEQMIQHICQNVENLTLASFHEILGGNVTTELIRASAVVEGGLSEIQKVLRNRLSTKTDEGEYLLNIESLYDDLEGNGELTTPFQF